jgi:parallel beta-helix repeat protein
MEDIGIIKAPEIQPMRFHEDHIMTPHSARTAIPSVRSRSRTTAYPHDAPGHGLRTPKIVQKRAALFGFVLPFMLLAGQAMAATYIVTNLNDSGPGSLRAAMLSANANKGSTVNFATVGTINLSSSLPAITAQVTLNGATAPGFTGAPRVSLNFNTNPGLVVAPGGDGSLIESLSLVDALSAAVTLQASKVAIQRNYIGLSTNGLVAANRGDGVKILASSGGNLIGNSDPVSSVGYFNTSNTTDFNLQPVTAWQGIRNDGTTSNQYLICGTTNTSTGLLYIGPIEGGGGHSFSVIYPHPAQTVTIATSVYGPDNLSSGLRLVGSYRLSPTTVFNYGFVWEGTTNQLPSGGVFRQIAYPEATYQFTHSTMGSLAVGNADGPQPIGSNLTLPIGPGVAYIYDLSRNIFVSNIVFPGSKSNSAYGIWLNSGNNYTICGGYSPLAVNNLANERLPLTQGKGFLVDYNAANNTFSNWTSFDYPNGPAGINFITHFESISSIEPGVYSLCADSVQTGSGNTAQGSWVSVRRQTDGTFDQGTWVDLNYPTNTPNISSSNSVYGDQVVGLVVQPKATPTSFSYQATVNIDFQLSNVISGNTGNGINISGSNGNVIAANYIGTNPAGTSSSGFGNGTNGILVTGASTGNLIGGQAAGSNNPTGSKNPANAVFQTPPEGNLISGNLANGILINSASTGNVLSGNFIGTDFTGKIALGNGQDGVAITNSNNNSLIGCTLFQNPFVFYNVIAGNRGNGLSINSSNNVTVQANFFGMGADNATSVPNLGNGLLVGGTSQNTQVGGVIPLGNVISGNALNGITVRDQATGFVSFNTFGGIAAFQLFPSPNGLDGILITSTGGNNTVRTCIISGNSGNGIEIAGNASGVQVSETSVGTNTNISGSIPNQGSGIVIRGTAHGNAIGGFQPSVEPQNFVSGNLRYGISVMDRAYNNSIFHTKVGVDALNVSVPNLGGGIVLNAGTTGTTIGGPAVPLQTFIQDNRGPGLLINSSTNNVVLNNTITLNSLVGVYAVGVCTGTSITGNTIQNNPTNVSLTNATGITFAP